MSAIRILLLEDSALDAELLSATLGEAGIAHEVRRAENRDSFIELLRWPQLQLILSDFIVPGFSGLTALEIAHETRPDVPFIFVSGALGEELAIDCLKRGATDYVLKHRMQRLAPAVNRAMAEVEDRRQRQAAEMQKQRAEDRLRQSEELFRRLVDGVQECAISVIDSEGRIVSWNRGAERMTGYSQSEAVGMPFNQLIAPVEQSRVWEAACQAAISREGEFRDEVLFARKDGSSFMAALVLSATRLGEGELRGYLSIVRDVTDHRQREQEVRRARDAAEAANNAKDRFLAMLSHELRTPLTPILTAVQLLDNDPRLDRELANMISMIRRNVELEARLIDDMLDLTRVSRGKLQLHRQTTDAHAAIRSVMEICDVEVRSKGLTCHVELEATQHFVHADPARLQQVLWNLVKNALKFTPAGGKIFVRTRNADPIDDGRPASRRDRARKHQPRLVIEVQDTGIGIAPEALERIFDAFEQADASIARLFGGLGLGLSISKALVDLHEGTLNVSSSGVGQGATFTISLETVNAPAPQATPSLNDRPADDTALRILLVEDHPDTLRVMTRLLKRDGHDVQTANTVAAALAVAGAGQFDLLISDIGLPDGSGYDLMRQLQSRRPIQGIVLSGFGMEEDIRRSREAGFVEHLTKPVNATRLSETIRQVTARR